MPNRDENLIGPADMNLTADEISTKALRLANQSGLLVPKSGPRKSQESLPRTFGAPSGCENSRKHSRHIIESWLVPLALLRPAALMFRGAVEGPISNRQIS